MGYPFVYVTRPWGISRTRHCADLHPMFLSHNVIYSVHLRSDPVPDILTILGTLDWTKTRSNSGEYAL